MSKTKTTEESAPKSEKEPWYWIALGGFAMVCAAVGFIRVAEGGFKGASWVYEALERGHNSLSYQTNIASIYGRLESQSDNGYQIAVKLYEMRSEINNLGTSNMAHKMNILLLQNQIENLSKKLDGKQDKFRNPWYDTIIITNLAVSNIIHFDQPVGTINLTNGYLRVK